MSEFRRDVPPVADVTGHALLPWLLLYAAAVLLGNQLSAVLRYPDVGTAVLFPPYAVLTAALVLSPPRHWALYVLVGALAHFATHGPQGSVGWVLVADGANVLSALAGAVMLRRLFAPTGDPRLDGIPVLLGFVFVAVLIAPAIGATIGAANVVAHVPSATYWDAWRGWLMSDALTGLTLLPALFLAIAKARTPRAALTPLRAIEAAAVVVALGGTSAIAFLVPAGTRWLLPLHLYAPLPVLIWTALRFGSFGASLALVGVTFAAIGCADRNTGPFVTLSADGDVLVLQLFVVLTALPVLCIAAVSGARQSIVQLHRALLASLRDRVAIIDARGVVLEVNDSWRRWGEMGGVAPPRRAHVGDNYAVACREAADRGGDGGVARRAFAGVMSVLSREQHRFEMEYDDDQNGRPQRYALSVEALERIDGGAVVTTADVTARHQARTEAEQQRVELSHLARVAALGQLSGALAHELNQPLTSIGANAQAGRHLLKRRRPDMKELDAILEDILTDNRRATEVIRRLRALLRRGEARLQPIDAAELIGEVLALARAELISQRVSATSYVAAGLPPVLADRVQLQQVLLNLILNACDAMRTTAPSERRLTLLVDGDGKNVRIAIRDSGSGITPALLQRLFEPFVTTKPEGLGLGLSISRTIIAAHGGRLWAENNVERGATLYCQLPAAVDAGVVLPPFAGIGADVSPVGVL